MMGFRVNNICDVRAYGKCWGNTLILTVIHFTFADTLLTQKAIKLSQQTVQPLHLQHYIEYVDTGDTAEVNQSCLHSWGVMAALNIAALSRCYISPCTIGVLWSVGASLHRCTLWCCCKRGYLSCGV